MAFSFFSKHTQNETLVLLVDIGSASVGGSLVRVEKGKTPHILATTRENISFQDELSTSRFIFAMNHALDRVLKNIQKKQLELSSGRKLIKSGQKSKISGAPDYIFCTLSSPWFILKSRHINIARKEAFEITPHTLDEFLNEDIERLKEELKETLPPKDVRIIEKSIIQMKLNGYDVKDPYGRKVSQVEMVMTVGVSSLRVIKGIEKRLSNFFHTESLRFGAFPVTAFNAIRDIFSEEKNFLFLDITGEATDVSLISNELLTGTASFPYGKNFFIREISAGLHIPHEEAASLLNMFLKETLHSSKQNNIKELIKNVESKWLSRFEKTLVTLSKEGVIPKKVFFTADTDIEKLFTDIINKAKTEVRTGDSFEIEYFDQSIVAKYVSFEAEVVRDPFLVIEALFAAKVISLLKK